MNMSTSSEMDTMEVLEMEIAHLELRYAHTRIIKRESLVALREILRLDEPDEVKQRKIQEGFDVYQSKGLDGKNTVLITGYLEAIMDGSLVKTERHRYPLYRCLATNCRRSRKWGSATRPCSIQSKELVSSWR